MDFIHIAFALVGMTFGFGIAWLLLASRHSGSVAQLVSFKEDTHLLQREKTALHERAVKAEAELQHVKEKIKDQQELLRAEFKDTADKLLEQITNKFTLQSEKKIGDLLNPMQQHLNEFKKLVVESFTTQGKEQHTLKNEIEKIVFQADSLTKALRGDVKAQGNWGEIMLERVLEESGLRRDEDYKVQPAFTDGDGARKQPDIVVYLPNNKHIIIDAKVSLTAYDRYCAAKDDITREAQAKEFVRSVKEHVKNLESKRYQGLESLGTPDFVLLFMPTEGAFSFAMQQDAELHSHAWGRKIAIVSPTTLFASLRTIASLWNMERQNRNTEEIVRRGELMYSKFVGFVEDMESIGQRLNQTQESYDEALKKLHTGRGNLVADAEKLVELGVKSTKPLPKRFSKQDTEVA